MRKLCLVKIKKKCGQFHGRKPAEAYTANHRYIDHYYLDGNDLANFIKSTKSCL